mgnify:CR=1 FL=1
MPGTLSATNKFVLKFWIWREFERFYFFCFFPHSRKLKKFFFWGSSFRSSQYFSKSRREIFFLAKPKLIICSNRHLFQASLFCLNLFVSTLQLYIPYFNTKNGNLKAVFNIQFFPHCVPRSGTKAFLSRSVPPQRDHYWKRRILGILGVPHQFVSVWFILASNLLINLLKNRKIT